MDNEQRRFFNERLTEIERMIDAGQTGAASASLNLFRRMFLS